jgi:hypothetical protein
MAVATGLDGCQAQLQLADEQWFQQQVGLLLTAQTFLD